MALFANIAKSQVSIIENLTRNAWPAFECTERNGWILRFANGYRQRGNSVWTENYSGNDIEEDIDYAEKWYADRKSNALFKTTAYSEKMLINKLTERNYSSGRETLVMLKENVSCSDPVEYSCLKCPDDEWFSMNKESDDETDDMFRRILTSIKVESYFIKLYQNNEPAGSFYFVVQEEYAGLYSLYIMKKFRRLGLGASSLNIIRELSGSIAKHIYLQVEKDNLPAVQMYRKQGFSIIYNYIYSSKTKKNSNNAKNTLH